MCAEQQQEHMCNWLIAASLFPAIQIAQILLEKGVLCYPESAHLFPLPRTSLVFTVLIHHPIFHLTLHSLCLSLTFLPAFLSQFPAHPACFN